MGRKRIGKDKTREEVDREIFAEKIDWYISNILFHHILQLLIVPEVSRCSGVIKIGIIRTGAIWHSIGVSHNYIPVLFDHYPICWPASLEARVVIHCRFSSQFSQPQYDSAFIYLH